MIANDFGQLQGYQLQGQSEQDKRDQLAQQNYFTQAQLEEASQQHADAVAQQQARFLADQRQQQLQNNLALQGEDDRKGAAKLNQNYFDLQSKSLDQKQAELDQKKADHLDDINNAGMAISTDIASLAPQKTQADVDYADAQKRVADIMATGMTKAALKGKTFVSNGQPDSQAWAETANRSLVSAIEERDKAAQAKKQIDAEYHGSLKTARGLGFDLDNPLKPSKLIHIRTGKLFPLNRPSNDSYFSSGGGSLDEDEQPQDGVKENQVAPTPDETPSPRQAAPVSAPVTHTTNAPNYLAPIHSGKNVAEAVSTGIMLPESLAYRAANAVLKKAFGSDQYRVGAIYKHADGPVKYLGNGQWQKQDGVIEQVAAPAVPSPVVAAPAPVVSKPSPSPDYFSQQLLPRGGVEVAPSPVTAPASAPSAPSKSDVILGFLKQIPREFLNSDAVRNAHFFGPPVIDKAKMFQLIRASQTIPVPEQDRLLQLLNQVPE